MVELLGRRRVPCKAILPKSTLPESPASCTTVVACLRMHRLMLSALLASSAAADLASDVRIMSQSRFLAPKLAAMNDTVPQQLLLSLVGNGTSMQLTFVTNWQCDGNASYGQVAQPNSPLIVDAVESTYSAGLGGWNGSIHTAILTDLVPGASYTYTACCSGNCAAPETFVQPVVPGPDAEFYSCVTADMGTVQLFGWLVADRIVKEHTTSGRPFDLVVLAGDVSYATTDPPNDEIEYFWDLFGVQAAGWASTTPFMVTVGNHEHVPGNITDATGHTYASDYAAFQARYPMPGAASGGNASMWFSWNQGPVHFISTSSEIPYTPGTPQYAWIQADLAAVDKTVTPWTILLTHRPLLSVVTDESGDHIPGGPRLTALEPLFKQYGVDLVIQGHQHCYERIHPNWNGTVVQTPSGVNNTYSDPGAPLYVVQATSGAVLQNEWISPIPDWSAVHNGQYYGFGRMSISTVTTMPEQAATGTAGSAVATNLRGSASNSASTSTSDITSAAGKQRVLFYEFADTDGVVRDTWTIVKSA